MTALANTLSMQLDRDVTDLTELKGLYDFRLSYTPEGVLATLPIGPDGTRPETPGTDVFTALAERLGLKLESRKGPVRTVFVDSMEKTPVENQNFPRIFRTTTHLLVCIARLSRHPR